MSIAVITDSTANLTPELIDKYDINVIPLNVLFDGVSYREIEELSCDSFYQRMKHEKNLPTTSQPAMGEYVDLLERLKKEGITDVIAIHLSSGISGTYQGAITAGDLVEGINVHAFDSEISASPQGFYALRAAEMKSESSVESILQELEAMKEETKAYFMVDDLKNLQKGGRLTGAQALIGSMLQVKPILHFEDTKIVPYEKVRTKKKAMKAIESLMHEFADGFEEATGCIIHGNDAATAENWAAELEREFPNVKFIVTEFSPVIGTHLGEKSLGFGITNRKLEL